MTIFKQFERGRKCANAKLKNIVYELFYIKLQGIYRVGFVFGSLLIWAYSVLQDVRSLLYTRYPIVVRALGLAAECAREKRYLAYKDRS